MNIAELKNHPNNNATFRDLAGEEFEDLKASIRDHGIIEPVVINQHGVIICGHQRVRACVELSIADVPVIVREVANDEEHETLLIEENLRRRQLLPSESFKAVKRLYELRGIELGNNGGSATVADLADELGKSERTVRTMRTLADLIPPLAAMLDAGMLNQTAAYQIAQMDEDGQQQVFSMLEDQRASAEAQKREAARLTTEQAKKIKDDYNAKLRAAEDERLAQSKTLARLEEEISVLRKKLPTQEVVEKLARIETELDIERKKPPVKEIEVKIVPPDDYDDLKDAVEQSKKELAGYKRDLKEARRELKEARKEVAPVGLPEYTKRLTLIHGPVIDLSSIPDNSIDCIITDPPYPAAFLPAFSDLSRTAARVLKPGGSCIVMSGQMYIPEVVQRLGEHLKYHWLLSYLTPGGQAVQVFPRKVNTFWKPLLWFTKGDYSREWVGDVCKSQTNDNDKRFHHWGQSLSGMADVVKRFSNAGDTILDPFLGGGTTGVVALSMDRFFVGADVDAAAVSTAEKRIKEFFENV